MAGTLVSPGVSVSVTDESFYFPVTATTVPLIFLATQYGKTQADGVTPAQGTLEHSVVRTITSLTQSLQLYGIPSFRNDISGNEFHGDARNEYGLLALNNALGALNRAFVVRANVDLADAETTFVSLGVPVLQGAPMLSPGSAGNGSVSMITATNNKVHPQKITIQITSANTFSVSGSQYGLIGNGMIGANFRSNIVNFVVQSGSAPFAVGDQITFDLANSGIPAKSNIGNGEMVDLELISGINSPETFTVTMISPNSYNVTGSLSGPIGSGVVGSPFENRIGFTVYAGTVPFVANDSFTVTASFVTVTNPLGADDTARRMAIVQALQSEINSNTEVRSEIYEYNLILCPGYYECVDEMLKLSGDVFDEAFVIGDTPGSKNPEQIAMWANSSERKNSTNVAYYYPWALMSNMDGRDVLGAPSGVSLRTIAYSDSVSYVWSAPAGANRGLITGVNKLGYFTGEAGKATTFIECNLNAGQQANLYEFYKNINPLVYMNGRGLLVWGQKTSSPVASSLDRINVSRLVMYIRRVLRKGGIPFVFEPNDDVTRKNLKSAADGILSDILTKRGLYDFVTKCDDSNNDADRIDRNELYLDVALKPVKTAEFVYIPIRLVSTGGDL